MTRDTKPAGNSAKEEPLDFSLQCPLPTSRYPNIVMAHGGGGRLMNDLIREMFVGVFGEPAKGGAHDSTVLGIDAPRLAFTTDSYVIRPLFFPGGDIGSLAVHGTVNDLAMSGAEPLWISAGFILEEGLPTETLWRVVRSMKAAADAAGVRVVTGDTKVVDRGKADGLYINTSGIGAVRHCLSIVPASVREGDAVIVSGDLGRHGIAVIGVREGLEFGSAVQSDSAALNGVVKDLVAGGIELHCLRDLTRGGLSSALNEISEAAAVAVEIEEAAVPVRPEVQGACEILGFDPLYVANEGRFVTFVPEKDAARTLEIMRAHAVSSEACAVGRVRSSGRSEVTLRTRLGTSRLLDMLSGEQLPRIC